MICVIFDVMAERSAAWHYTSIPTFALASVRPGSFESKWISATVAAAAAAFAGFN